MNASLLYTNFYNAAARFADQLWPRRCLLCHQVVMPDDYQLPLCQCCYHDLPVFTGPYCNNLRLKPNIARGLKQPKFDQLVCLAPYGWPFSHWISALKFRRHVNLAPTMGKLLARHINNHVDANDMPDVLIPLPLHKWRLFFRGFNQAEHICQSLANELSIPIDHHALTRIKATKAQSSLGKLARKQNVKGAFDYQAKQPYRHVAIIDDVITTGATVNQVCELLTQAGVTHISVWCICATPID